AGAGRALWISLVPSQPGFFQRFRASKFSHPMESSSDNCRSRCERVRGPPIYADADPRGEPSDGARRGGGVSPGTFAMSDVTRILSAIEHGDPKAADELLPLVYQELRRLAARRLSQEKPGQTLQATALVHEAYLGLVGSGHGQGWEGRAHFFAAA